MTVAELIKQLSQCDPDAEVIVAPLIRTEPLSSVVEDRETSTVELS